MENQYTEKRKHTRYPVTPDSLVIWNKCAGRVLNRSKGGMAIDLIETLESLPEKWETTFHCPTTGTNIEGLPLKIVRDEAIKLSDFGIKTQTVGVKFDNPTVFQQDQIRQHLCM